MFFYPYYDSIKLLKSFRISIAYGNQSGTEDEMKIILPETYLNNTLNLSEIERELQAIEEKLKLPTRTVEDIVRHIELLKLKQSLI